MTRSICTCILILASLVCMRTPVAFGEDVSANLNDKAAFTEPPPDDPGMPDRLFADTRNADLDPQVTGIWPLEAWVIRGADDTSVVARRSWWLGDVHVANAFKRGNTLTLYWVEGVFTYAVSHNAPPPEGIDPSAGPMPAHSTWHTRYEQDDDGPGIAVEMNHPGEMDDYVTVDEGGLGRVELVGADPQSQNTYEIKVETGPGPGAIVFSDDPAQPHSDVPGESEPPWDPGSGDVMELGDDGDGQWYDYRLVRARPGQDGTGGFTLGHTEFRAWMIDGNVTGFDDEAAVKHSDDIIVCDVKIVAATASDASADQPDPANVPLNASVPGSMGGTGEKGELRAKIWVKGPANTYPFVIMGEDKVHAFGHREIVLTGEGTDLTGYSDEFILRAEEQSDTANDEGLVVAEWPTGSGVSGVWATRDDSIVCYAIVGQLLPDPPEYSIDFQWTTQMDTPYGEVVDREDYQGIWRPVTETYDPKLPGHIEEYHGWVHQTEDWEEGDPRPGSGNVAKTIPGDHEHLPGVITIACATGHWPSEPITDTFQAGSFVRQDMTFEVATLPQGLANDVDIEFDLTVQRRVRFELLAQTNFHDFAGGSLSITFGIVGVGIPVQDDAKAIAAGNAGFGYFDGEDWLYTDEQGLIEPGALAHASVTGALRPVPIEFEDKEAYDELVQMPAQIDERATIGVSQNKKVRFNLAVAGKISWSSEGHKYDSAARAYGQAFTATAELSNVELLDE